MKKIFRRLFCDYQWYCAFRKTGRGKDVFHVIDMPKNHWAADPFLFEKDGVLYMFFEYTDTKKGKSVIAAKEIYPEEKANVVIYEFDGHTSYPCVFDFKDKIYIIPETSDSGRILLLECVEWPYVWKEKATLLDGILAVDTTVFHDGANLKLFVYTLSSEKEGNRELFVCNLDAEKGAVSDLTLLKTYSNIDGRPGGHCFTDGKDFFRVVQPGYNYYGERLDFYSFSFKNGKYEEKIAYSMKPSDIYIDRNINVVGVHTYNRCGSFEVVDLREDYKITFKVIRRFFSLLKLFGFRNLEKEKKHLYKTIPFFEKGDVE